MTHERKVTTPLMALLLLCLIGLLTSPAQATPPETIVFDSFTVYDITVGPPSISGTWDAYDGLIISSGSATIDHVNAGWNDAGLWLRNSHTTEVYTDSQGSFTLEAHVTNISGFSPFSGDGHWLITDGTGAYTNLKGQGTVTVYGQITTLPFLQVDAHYEGTAHYE